MNLYHSPKKHDDYLKIIETQKFKINKRFNYIKYIEYLIDHISKYKNPTDLPGNYPDSYVQAPFMGHGIYCFSNEDEAIGYRSNSRVIKIGLTENIYFLDLDDEDILFELNDMLKECKKKINTVFNDEEIRNNYLLLIELISTCLYEEFKNSQPAVGIILFWYNELLGKALPDLIKRTFFESKYYLLTNKNKISSIN